MPRRITIARPSVVARHRRRRSVSNGSSSGLALLRLQREDDLAGGDELLEPPARDVLRRERRQVAELQRRVDGVAMEALAERGDERARPSAAAPRP